MKNTDFTPAKVVGKAGEVINVRLNIRGEEGKLVKHSYKDPSRSVKVIGDNDDDFDVVNGPE